MYVGETCPRAECHSSNDASRATSCCSCMTKSWWPESFRAQSISLPFISFLIKTSGPIPTFTKPSPQTAFHENKLSDPKSGTYKTLCRRIDDALPFRQLPLNGDAADTER